MISSGQFDPRFSEVVTAWLAGRGEFSGHTKMINIDHKRQFSPVHATHAGLCRCLANFTGPPCRWTLDN